MRGDGFDIKVIDGKTNSKKAGTYKGRRPKFVHSYGLQQVLLNAKQTHDQEYCGVGKL